MTRKAIGVRLDEVTKAKIERLVFETKLWENVSDFVRSVVEKQIKKYWREPPNDF